MDRIIEFDLIFEPEKFGTRNGTMGMGLMRHNHTNMWTNLDNSQIRFIGHRIGSYLADVADDKTFFYRMACGDCYESPFRLSVGSRSHCPKHGFQYVVNAGDMTGYATLLPRYRPPAVRKTTRKSYP
jgi:hypothetical protein